MAWHPQLLVLLACVVALPWCDSAIDLGLHARLIRQKRQSCGADEYLHNNICCKKCQAGMFLKNHCTPRLDTECHNCTIGFYLDERSAREQCKQCRNCDAAHKLHIARRCSAVSNAICECDDGFFCSHRDGIDSCLDCTQHNTCLPGSGITKPVSSLEDVICRECGHGLYSAGGNVECKRHTNCSSLGKVDLLPVEKTKDVVCVNAETSTSLLIWIIAIVVISLIVIAIPIVVTLMKKYPNNCCGICKKTTFPGQETRPLQSNSDTLQQQNGAQPDRGGVAQTAVTEIANEISAANGEDMKLLGRDCSRGEHVAGAGINDTAGTGDGSSEDISPPSRGTTSPPPAAPAVIQNITNVTFPAALVQTVIVAIPNETSPLAQPLPQTIPPGNQARPDTQPLPDTQPHSSSQPCTVQQADHGGSLYCQASCEELTPVQGDLFKSARCPVTEEMTDPTFCKPIQEQGAVATGKDSCSFREPVEESAEPCEEPRNPVI